MPAGFQVINANGHFQIDENWKCSSLQNKYVYSGGTNTFSVNVTHLPLVLFYTTSTTDPIYLRKTVRSGNTLTYTVVGTGEVFVFGFIQGNPTPSGYGLQVFRPDGTLAFDSNMEVLKPLAFPYDVKSVVYVPEHTIVTTSSSYMPEAAGYYTPAKTPIGTPLTVPTGKKYAWMPQAKRWYWDNLVNGGFPGKPSGISKGTYALYHYNTEIKMKKVWLAYVQGGEYWPGSRTEDTHSFQLFDVTGM